MPFLTIRMILIMSLFSTQHMYSMERLRSLIYGDSIQFEQFSQFLPEVQLLVFKHSNNKANFQSINKHWSQVGSIKTIDSFDTIDYPHLSRIFLHAVYTKNYDGVENILKNSYLNKIEKKNLYYRYVDINQVGKEVVLDPYNFGNDKMIALLKKYNVSNAPSDTIASASTPLIMACLSGNSNIIEYFIISDKTNIKRALNVAVDCDHGKCIQQLIHNWSDAFGELYCGDEYRSLLCRQLFRRACINKSCKALKILLDDGYYNINEELSGATLLDEVIALEKEDCTFSVVIALLQKYYAKTSEQIADHNANVAQDNGHSWYLFY